MKKLTEKEEEALKILVNAIRKTKDVFVMGIIEKLKEENWGEIEEK